MPITEQKFPAVFHGNFKRSYIYSTFSWRTPHDVSRKPGCETLPYISALGGHYYIINSLNMHSVNLEISGKKLMYNKKYNNIKQRYAKYTEL